MCSEASVRFRSCALEFIHQRGLVHRDIKPEKYCCCDTSAGASKLLTLVSPERETFIRFISGTLPLSGFPELCTMVLEEGAEGGESPLRSAVEPLLDTWAFASASFLISSRVSSPGSACNRQDDFYEDLQTAHRSRQETPRATLKWKDSRLCCMQMSGGCLALGSSEGALIGEVKGCGVKTGVPEQRSQRGWEKMGRSASPHRGPAEGSCSDEY
ncbi:hypothetical protein cypCar_00026460 [Cyprinus carpio]|nr:hypothetical protein cypCar_00026460 [Cyprinus carpio]